MERTPASSRPPCRPHDPARPRAVRLLLVLALSGCASGAPTQVLFGAYFPFWLTSAIVGVAAAITAHRVFVARGPAGRVPYQLAVCAAIGSLVAVIFWLSGTGLI